MQLTIDPKTLTAIAVVVHLLVRLLKAGKLKQWIPARYRPLVAVALGGVAMGVDAMVAGTPLPQAALTAVLAVGLAVLGHDALIEGLRGGREIGAPKGVAAVLLLVLPLSCMSVSCSPSAQQAQAYAADTVARATNAAVPQLVNAYDQDGLAAIAVSDSRDEAEIRLERVRQKWRHVWDALDIFASAHDAWVAAIEANAPTAQVAMEVREAYCMLRGSAMPDVELPDYPVVPCGGTP